MQYIQYWRYLRDDLAEHEMRPLSPSIVNLEKVKCTFYIKTLKSAIECRLNDQFYF